MNKTARPLASTLSASLVLQVLVLFTGVVSARLLGPEGRGQLALIILWGTNLAALGELGIQTATAKLGASRNNSLAVLLSSALFAAVLASVATCTLGYLVVHSTIPAQIQTNAVAYLMFSVPLSLLRMPLLGILRAKSSYLEYNACRVLLVVPYAVMLGFFHVNGVTSVTAFAAANLLGNALSTGYGLWRVCKSESFALPQWGEIKGILSYGTVVHIGTLSSSETFRIDQIAASLLLSPYSLGIYTAASSVLALPRLIGQSVGIVALTEQAASVKTSAGRSAAHRVRQSILLTLIAVGGLVVIGPQLMIVAFGPEFASAGGAAILFALSGGLLSIRRVLSDIMRGAGEQRISTLCELLSLLLSLVLMTYFVRQWQVNGAASAFLIGNLVSLVALLPFFQAKMDIQVRTLVPTFDDVMPIIQRLKRHRPRSAR